MLTVQNPKKSSLAKKPAYSFVDNVSLGLRMPTSDSGCLSPEGDGLQPTISVQSCCREGGTLQTNNTGVCSQCLSHTGPAPAHCMCTLPAHTAQALGCSTVNHSRPALGCMHLPGLSCLCLGTLVVLRGADSIGPVFCAVPRSEQLR